MRYLCLLMLFALDERTAGLVDQVAASGQIVEIATPSSERLAPSVRIAPGAPPALGFRMIEAKLRHRFGDLDLVLDDAGH
ncbi:MAG TPA: hypothetical protein VE959_29560 [Bryobacteraceae bacterium]|nr:hypothetical protein [Bryobacteraceae bacterium]